MMKKKDKIFIALASILIILDQITKNLVLNYFIPNRSVPIIPKILDFTLVFNTGMAWGLFKGVNLFFVIVSFVVIGVFIRYYKKLPRPTWISAIILAGVIGNLIDRLRFGYVIDFVDFKFWPIFNVADSLISIGIVLVIITEQRNRRE